MTRSGSDTPDHPQHGLTCPECGYTGSMKTCETRNILESVRRRRVCPVCASRFTTIETISKRKRGDAALSDTEWWSGTAKHMWRSYFVMLRKKQPRSSIPELNIFSACNTVYSHFDLAARNVLESYYYVRAPAETIAARYGSSKYDVMNIIARANRAVIEEIGLAERKETARK